MTGATPAVTPPPQPQRRLVSRVIPHLDHCVSSLCLHPSLFPSLVPPDWL
jgi:hypothetical protein